LAIALSRGVLSAKSLVLSIFMVAAAPRVALAGEKRVESRRGEIDVQAIAPLLKRGELALVESHANGKLAQLVLFAAINAPAAQIYDAITDVEAHSKYMKSVVGNKIIKRQGDMIAFEWELDVPVLNLKGTRALRGKKPDIVEIRGVSGNFKESRERWELIPLDEKRTLAVFYRALDVESGGVLLKTMISMESSMEHGIALAAGFVHIRDIKKHLEKLPEPKVIKKEGPVPEIRKLILGERELAGLSKLLAHGQLAVIESNADGSLSQVELLGSVDAPKEKLATVIQGAEKYPEFIPNIVEQRRTPEGKNVWKLEYELEVPMVNLDGVSRMTIEPDGSVDTVAVSGDITRGRWRWETLSLDEKRCLAVHYAYSDVSETSWFVKQLIEKQPLFEHGIAVAASTVALRAMKARAEGKR
jgi:ribosome-associated toxin RatA of RatAB toxin-antitoxin module